MPLLIRSLKYVGGKAGIVDWVIANLPGGTTYVEAFAGSAWVLLNKPRHKVEVYNDSDKTMVTFFRVLQDEEKAEKLIRKLEFTLYSREEFGKAIEIVKNPANYSDIDVAWARYIIQEEGFSGKPYPEIYSWGVDLQKKRRRGLWRKLKYLWLIHQRLEGVQIDNRDALDVIRYWDSPKTVFYLDPPYPPDTRKSKKLYGDNEQDAQFHEQLIDLLCQISGSFALSSYPNPIYDQLVNRNVAYVLTHKSVASSIGKTRLLRDKNIMGTKEWEDMIQRTECLYIKSNGYETQPMLFRESAADG